MKPQRERRIHTQALSWRIILVVLLAALVIFFLGERKNFGWQQYLQLSLDGLRGGTIYALIALGFVTIYNITGVINFAQGGFAMLGAMLAITVNEWSPLATWPPSVRLFVAALVAIAITTIVGMLIERLTIAPARDADPLTHIIITVGVYLVIQGVALLIWGTQPYALPAFTTLAQRDATLRLGSIIIKGQSFWIWGTTFVTMVMLYWFFEQTMPGRALRACAVNRTAARLMGISPSRMSLFAFALAAALGALGGIVLAPATRPTYDMGLALGLKGFVAATMGGMTNPGAAVVGGLLLGSIENIGAGVTRAGLKDIFSFIILIWVLLFRPHGLFGRPQSIEKV
ncbi:MAG: branched-chain amino acid ABC transporter permease [Ardenticatenia bacterium]|nr:MAG: branched-chain amino acid ABC transporter permease [Ardenticatenia bacterium]